MHRGFSPLRQSEARAVATIKVMNAAKCAANLDLQHAGIPRFALCERLLLYESLWSYYSDHSILLIPFNNVFLTHRQSFSRDTKSSPAFFRPSSLQVVLSQPHSWPTKPTSMYIFRPLAYLYIHILFRFTRRTKHQSKVDHQNPCQYSRYERSSSMISWAHSDT